MHASLCLYFCDRSVENPSGEKMTTPTIDSDRLSALIEDTLPEGADPRARPILEALIGECLGLAADGTAVADLKLVGASLAEIRRGLACFRPYPQARKVTCFGSARTSPDSPVYRVASDFGRAIAGAGFMVITGGGPGIMQACNEGAGRRRSFGVGIALPFEQDWNAALRGSHKLVRFKYFFTRKLFFLKEASAVVFFPGGFGTHDEAFESLTLIQTGKSQLVPVVCLEERGGGYWKAWDAFVREQLLASGRIGEHDRALYRIAHTVEEAVAEIVAFYKVFHSMRFLRKRVVMRLNAVVENAVLDTLSDEFADILHGKPIRPCSAYKEEADEPDLLALPRVLLHFDGYGYGRLRQLIDRLNRLAA